MPQFRVDGVGEVDRRGPGGQRDDPALGSEGENLVRIEISRQRLEELARVLGLPLPLEEAVQPGETLQTGAVRGRSDRPRDDPGFGEPMHPLRADLDVNGFPGPVHDGRVQRLVHVELGHGHEVTQPPSRRPPHRMHDSKNLVAVSNGINEDEDPDDVVVVPRFPATFLRPLIDREQMAGPGRDLAGDPCVRQTVAELIHDRRKLTGLTLRGRELVDHQLGTPVFVGMENSERTVFQFPLDDADAEPVCQWREDFQSHLSDTRLFDWRLETQGPHVVQAVGNLDDQDPVVLGQGDDQLAQRLRLGCIAEPHLVELGHAVNDVGDLRAESLGGGIQGIAGVLDGVVQQGGNDRGGVHPELGEDPGDRQRMGDVRIAAMSRLTGMQPVRHVIGVDDKADIGLGMVLAVHVDDVSQRRRHRGGCSGRRHAAGEMGKACAGQPGDGQRTRGLPPTGAFHSPG